MSTRASIFVSFALVAGILVVCCQLASANNGPTKEDHYLLQNECASVLNEQISWELYASIVYLNMAAYFDKPSVARSGYSKYFKDQSLEEYTHATAFIDYINSRNATVRRISVDESPKSEWSSPKEALTDAIKLEKHVFSKLHYIHDVADQKCQDKHLMDFLESKFFTEQVESIKELQTMLTKINIDDPTSYAIIEHFTDEKLKKEL